MRLQAVFLLLLLPWMIAAIQTQGPPSDAFVNETMLYIPKGGQLSLTCHVKDRGIPEADISWYKVGTPDVLVKQASYVVDHVTTKDRGLYYCTAVNKWGSSRLSQNVLVSVGWRPSGARIQTPPNNICVGQSLNLTCKLTEPGFPMANIFWYTSAITDTHVQGPSLIANVSYVHEASFNIANVSDVNQAGPYFCVGMNAYGNCTPSQPVTIPVKTPLTVEARSPNETTLHPLYDKNTYILNITVSGTDLGKPQLIYEGSNKTSELRNSSYYITITDVHGHFAYGQKTARMYSIRFNVSQELFCDSVSDLDGAYRFVASKKNSWEPWKDQEAVMFNLDLQYAAIWKHGPENLPAVIGDRNVTITCGICANPEAALRWTMIPQAVANDVIINQSGASITIPEVKAHHIGVYICTASNTIDGREYQRTFEVWFGITQNDWWDDDEVLIYIYVTICGLMAITTFGWIIGFAVLWCCKLRDSSRRGTVTNKMIEMGPSRHFVTSPPSAAPLDRSPQTHIVDEEAQYSEVTCKGPTTHHAAAANYIPGAEHSTEYASIDCSKME